MGTKYITILSQSLRIQRRNVISYQELGSRANHSGIFEPTEVAQAVQFLHELGSLQHFTSQVNTEHDVCVSVCFVFLYLCNCIVFVHNSSTHWRLISIYSKYVSYNMYSWLSTNWCYFKMWVDVRSFRYQLSLIKIIVFVHIAALSFFIAVIIAVVI